MDGRGLGWHEVGIDPKCIWPSQKYRKIQMMRRCSTILPSLIHKGNTVSMAFKQVPVVTKNPKTLTYNMIPKSYRLCASKWAWVQAGRRKAGGVAPFPPQPSTRRATYPSLLQWCKTFTAILIKKIASEMEVALRSKLHCLDGLHGLHKFTLLTQVTSH